MHEIKYLGIDIGGAHLKVIGLNSHKEIIFVEYKKCKVWEGVEKLKKAFQKINNTINNKSVKCAITMSAELCDNFKSRKHGANKIVGTCKHIEFDNYFYTSSKKVFSKKPKYKELISMNWHGIGKFLETKIKNAILIDFGSTTTDFICIKNYKLINEYIDDFSRLNNHELLYTGLTRTPIFGLTSQLYLKNNLLNIIPEFFSTTSDIYRILKKLNKNIDLDDTANNSQKTLKESMIRVSRSFGFDYETKNKEKVKLISKKLSLIQLDKIFNTTKKLKNKHNLNKAPIIVSGIGQDILLEYFKKKKFKVEYFQKFFKKSQLRKEATFHAPALSIALLLQELK